MPTMITVKDDENRTIHINIKNIEAYQASPNAEGLNGEQLAAEIIKSNKGNILSVERYKNGLRNDGSNGEAQFQHFNDNGVVIQALRYSNDKQNDGPNGEPAFQSFNDQGALLEAISYRDNKKIGTVAYNEREIEALREKMYADAQMSASKFTFIPNDLARAMYPQLTQKEYHGDDFNKLLDDAMGKNAKDIPAGSFWNNGRNEDTVNVALISKSFPEAGHQIIEIGTIRRNQGPKL